MWEWPLVKAAGILRRREWCDEKSAIEDLCASNCLLWRLVSLEKRDLCWQEVDERKAGCSFVLLMVGYIKLRRL